MMLGEVPFDEIEVGTRVLSSIDMPGEVTKVHKLDRYKDWDQDGWMVRIRWASGREVDYCHWWMLDKVTVVDTITETEDGRS